MTSDQRTIFRRGVSATRGHRTCVLQHAIARARSHTVTVDRIPFATDQQQRLHCFMMSKCRAGAAAWCATGHCAHVDVTPMHTHVTRRTR
jgi:hypothetical protein